MIRPLPLLGALASSLSVLAMAPSVVTLKADTPAASTATAQAGTHSVLVVPSQKDAQSAVERLPNSQIAWEFDREADGTVAIKGPNGAIWRGNLQVGNGPYMPQSAPQFPPGTSITIRDPKTGQPRHYEIVPPDHTPAPNMPNYVPIVPPGQSQP